MARPDSDVMHRPRWRGGLAAVLLLALPLLVMQAALDGYFLLDDFGMLSIVRLIGNPLPAFVENHIPGGLYYRPLGIQLWWLAERAFGAQAAWHYLCNALLHGAVVVALWRWLAAATHSRGLAFAAALVYAIHPVAIGTTLWLSDRFDLLAMLFGTLGLGAASRFAVDGRVRDAGVALASIALALLAKEIALVPLAAIGALWFCAEPGVAVRRRLQASAVLVAVVAAWFTLRALVIADAGAAHMFAARPLAELVAAGLANGFGAAVDYLGYLPRLAGWQAVSVIAGLGVLAVAMLAGAVRPWTRARLRLFAAGSVLAVAPLVLQFPLLAFQDPRLDAAGDGMLLAINARHFYVSCAGVIVVVVAVLAPLCTFGIRAGSRGAGIAVAAAVLLVAGWLPASQQMARIHRDLTRQQHGLVEAAHAALASIALPGRGCHVFLLDTGNWPFAWVSDEAIKGTTRELDRLAGCLIQTEHTPWYHIVAGGRVGDGDLAPLVPAPGVARARLGAAEILVLNLDPSVPASTMRNAVFLGWTDGRFVDITSDVLAGRRTLSLRCNRRPAACPP